MRLWMILIILCYASVLLFSPTDLQAFDGNWGGLGSSLSVSKVAESIGWGSSEAKGPKNVLSDAFNTSWSLGERVGSIDSLSSSKDSYKWYDREDWITPISNILYCGDRQLVNFNPLEDPIELKTSALNLLVDILPNAEETVGNNVSGPIMVSSVLNTVALSVEKTQDAGFQKVLIEQLKASYSDCKKEFNYKFLGNLDDGLNPKAREIIGEENLYRPAREIGFINVDKSFEPVYRNVLSSTNGLTGGTEADKTILAQMVSNDPYGQLSVTQKSEWGALIAGGNTDITNERKASLFADYVNGYMDTSYYLGTAVREARAGNDRQLKIAEFITKSFQTEDGNTLVFSPDGFGNYSYSIFKAPVRQINVQVGNEQRAYDLPLTRGVRGTSIEYVPAKQKSNTEILTDSFNYLKDLKIKF